MNQSSTLSAGTYSFTWHLSNDFGSACFFPSAEVIDVIGLLRTRIGGIVGIPRAKAEEYLAAPAEESTRAPAQLGDPMDLQPGQ